MIAERTIRRVPIHPALRPVTDLGYTILSTHPTSRHAAKHALREGSRYGYPACCVAQFALDVLHDRLPYLRRGTVPAEDGSGCYVPCYLCCVEMGREAA